MNQLREQGAEDRFAEVLEEMPRVRREMGYPPLVTPSSQIVGTQATMNVLMGERYKVISQQAQDFIRGLYGRSPAPIDPDVRQLAIGDKEIITCRPADLLEPGFEKAKTEIGDLAKSEEDVLSYCLFPQVAREFLTKREEGFSTKETTPIPTPRPTAKSEEEIEPSYQDHLVWKLAAWMRR